MGDSTFLLLAITFSVKSVFFAVKSVAKLFLENDLRKTAGVQLPML